MPHNSRKECSSTGRNPEHETAAEIGLSTSGHEVDHTVLVDGKQHENVQIPFYDDPNHVAYGWQQMVALSNFLELRALIRGTQGDPPLSPGSRPQIWPAEQQREPAKVEQSGFNPYPRRGQGPRRPRSLTDAGDGTGSIRAKFKPFVNPPSTKPEGSGVGDVVSQDHLPRRKLGSKDVNQKLLIGQSEEDTSSYLKPIGDLRKGNQQSRSRRLIVDELEAPQHEDRKIKRMPALPEEPAPLRIRKTHSRSKTPEQACMLRAEYMNEKAVYPDPSCDQRDMKVTIREIDAGDDMMKNLTSAIRDWQLMTFAESPPCRFKHRSAVSKPLTLAAIMAAKEEKTMRSRPESDTGEALAGRDRGNLHDAEGESVELFTAGVSSDFEKPSVPEGDEHNGSRRSVAREEASAWCT